MNLPNKLITDSIAEAICEIRFETHEISEIVVGKLAAVDTWQDYEHTRLPVSDIPTQIRLQDSDFKHQPLMQLNNIEKNRSVRIGTHVLAYNNVGEYAGWEQYYLEIRNVINILFKTFPKLEITRLGIRYINALNEKSHYISSLNDLEIKVNVGNQELTKNINLNYKKLLGDNFEALVRLSTPSFLKGVNIDMNLLVDLDVYSKDVESLQDKEKVISWIETAHQKEKEEFFSLFRPETLEKIVEE